ncbi:MarR family transcriptional regulator [Streptomyces sp. NPDC006288]|uniref:MarR family transcriptional regulator n=1 Tax=Streptomyces sp. NPDC006288 TaxID=3156743 RepID=UPI0033A91C09
MATENLSSALRAPAASRPYAKALRGYGKRTTPDQPPSSAADFRLLPERERYIAGYVDRLPEGGAMDVKSLARALPLYGQMAVGTALRALGVAGHLRRVRCQVVDGGRSRWVTRTFWSRTAHDSEWWDAFTKAENHRATQAADTTSPPLATAAATATPAEADIPTPAAPPRPATVPAVPRQRNSESAEPDPSPAYLALARLGRIEPRLALSAADCTVLEELAAAWLGRGVNTDYLTRALVSGLPAEVGSPVGLVRRRLIDKIPPRLPATQAPAVSAAPVRRVLMECTGCGAPGPPEALPDGLCRACRTAAPGSTQAAPAEVPAARDVQELVSGLRDLLRAP